MVKRQLAILGIIFAIALLASIAPASAIDIGGDTADRSMITVEGDTDEFFLDAGDSKFVWDIITDKEDTTIMVTLSIINPSLPKKVLAPDHLVSTWTPSDEAR